MMYQDGRFAREAIRENVSLAARCVCTAAPEYSTGDALYTKWENDAREAYHSVIALSSINHVTYARYGSMYSM